MRIAIAILFAILATAAHADTKIAWLYGWGTASAPSAACPYTGYSDGCGVSNGLFYAPAVSQTSQPTSAQWSTYARQSTAAGQTWASPHPQPWNLPAIDYPVGPNIPAASANDVANWGSYSGTGCGSTGHLCGCAYYASGYSHNYNTLLPGLVCTGNGGAGVTISGVQFGPNGGRTTCVPILLDTGADTGLYTITNNFWTNAQVTSQYGCGWVNGGNGAVSYLTIPSGTFIDVKHWNNYYNGMAFNACCATQSAGTGVAMMGTNQMHGSVDSQYNYAIGLGHDGYYFSWAAGGSTCSGPGSVYYGSGYNLTIAHNYMEGFATIFGSGHSKVATITPASNTASFNGTVAAGVLTTTSQTGTPAVGDSLYGFGVPYGVKITGGTSPTYTLSNSSFTVASSVAMATNAVLLCNVANSYNVILWPGQNPAAGSATFFGWATNQGAIEYHGIDHNTSIVNITGGAVDTADTWSFTTNADNTITITGGSSNGPYPGAQITGSGMGLQSKISGSGVGSVWNAGCNDTGGTQCPTQQFTIVGSPPVTGTNSTFTNQASTVGLFNMTHAYYGTTAISANYVDPTGANTPLGNIGTSTNNTVQCGAAVSITGNINMTTGAALNTPGGNYGGGC